MTRPIRRTFPGRHDQVACARDFVRRIAYCCPVLDEAVLLTSELCMNALQHTASVNGGCFEVTVYRREESLRVEVRDDGAKTVPSSGASRTCAKTAAAWKSSPSSLTGGDSTATNTAVPSSCIWRSVRTAVPL